MTTFISLPLTQLTPTGDKCFGVSVLLSCTHSLTLYLPLFCKYHCHKKANVLVGWSWGVFNSRLCTRCFIATTFQSQFIRDYKQLAEMRPFSPSSPLLFSSPLFCTCSLKCAHISFTSSSLTSLLVILDHSNLFRLQTFHHRWQRPIHKEELIHCAHSFNTGIFYRWTTFYQRYFCPGSQSDSNTVYTDAGAASLNKKWWKLLFIASGARNQDHLTLEC